MRLTNYFLPVLKENPQEAQVVSHQLMLRAGMIRQLQSGIYNWLPYGLAMLRRIELIIREEMNAANAIELLMPTIQPIELWEESGRGGYGDETLKVKDRHDRTMIYGPTNEEVITDMFRKNVRSYKELPLNLYQIQWKFRDEIRPRFGVMRGREFLMKDAYTFSLDEASHIALYNQMYVTYLRIFKRLGLKAIPVRADTGLIGGNLSHEFQVMAETGESALYYDAAFDDLLAADNIDIEAMQALYAAADEKHDAANCPVPPERLKAKRGIEVGHIFYFDTKYSSPMKAMVTDATGQQVTVKMGAHGIGVSRLVAAIIEASHDEKGMILPESVAPFTHIILNLKQGDAACDAACEQLYHHLLQQGKRVMYDNRTEGAGSKFATADLLGIPTQLAIGPRGVASGMLEVKARATGEKQEQSLSSFYG
jgi:prolyl-tRNA synthetase